VTNSTRDRIGAAFDRELEASPVPAVLRSQAVHAAVIAPRQQAQPPRLLALVATVLAIAVIATLVLGSHLMRTSVPTRPGLPSAPPMPRANASLVFDPAHGDLVLFGGQSGVGGKGGQAPVNDTYTWDGKNWSLHHSASAPPARSSAVMAYDAAHRDVVLFGGTPLTVTPARGGPAYLNDTWTWNGSTWKQQHPAHAPGFTFSWPATMAFDPVSKTVLLYGFTQTTTPGATGTVTSMNAETWSWDGSDWTKMAPASSPDQEGAMATGSNHVYLLALSSGRVGGQYVSRMWQWDGTTWSLLGGKSDFVELGGAMAFDQSRGQLVLFNGDTWTWSGSAWSRQHPQMQPLATGYLAYFAPLHEVVSWSDVYANTNNDMWTWDGSTWNLVQRGAIEASPSPNGQLEPTTPGAAEAYIRQNVTSSSPVLLPTWLPVTMEARILDSSTDFFNVEYRSDQRDKSISLGIVVPNPPPGDQSSSDTEVRFRNAAPLKSAQRGYAEYVVYDTTAPRSDRWLMWFEPGNMANPQTKAAGVVPYFLSASGLTDAEFWQVANSLR
jgi:hypothetical protein